MFYESLGNRQNRQIINRLFPGSPFLFAAGSS